MNTRRPFLMLAASLPAAGCAVRPSPAAGEDRRAQALAAETGFAATLARRDLAAFAECIAEDAVFINGGTPLRGRPAIVEHWKRFFAPATAPFSWKPEIVELSAQATLAYTEGPVMDPSGKVFARFFSTWQLQGNGRWLVVFDNGQTLCKT